jgi:hypothetical protein
VYTCNPSIHNLRLEGHEFKAHLGYRVRAWFENNKNTTLEMEEKEN